MAPQAGDPEKSSANIGRSLLPPEEEIQQALDEFSRLQDDDEARRANTNAWSKRWTAAGYRWPQQMQQVQQHQQQEQQRQQERLRKDESASGNPSDTFIIEFSRAFTIEETQVIAESLADYFRACGGAGFEYEFDV